MKTVSNSERGFCRSVPTFRESWNKESRVILAAWRDKDGE